MELIQSDDRLLLYKVTQGSEHAFSVLFDKYWEKAYSDAYKRVKEYDVSKDIVQEIFTHIWINRATLRIENLQAYLHTAIRNKAIKFISNKIFTRLKTVSFFHSFAPTFIKSKIKIITASSSSCFINIKKSFTILQFSRLSLLSAY